MSNKVKKTLLWSSLIATGGFFIAKLIGLFYSMPFSYILGSDELMNYYGSAYRIYSYILNIFTAGIPFAIATLVAKYSTLGEDTKVQKMKKISILISTLLGFIGMLVMIGISGFIAPILSGNTEGSQIMQQCLCILALAIFFVPLLSAYRGFIQGKKQMSEYAFSQSFEQIFRVGSLLSISCVLIYMLGFERRFALYVGVFSTSVASIAGIAQIYWFDKKHNKIEKGITLKEACSDKELVKEFMLLALPYFLSAVVGYSDDIFNTTLLPSALKLTITDTAQFDTIMASVNYVGIKLTAIPMILAPGFTSAMIPHITEALTKNDHETVRKNILDCISIVLYIATFLTMCIILFAKPLFATIFYTDNIELATRTLQLCAIEGFMCTLVPVISSLTMTCGFRKTLVKRQAICAVLKGVTMYPLILATGYAGGVISTVIAFGWLALSNCISLKKEYDLSFGKVYRTVALLVIAVLAMYLVVTFVYSWVPVIDAYRINTIINMCMAGICALIAFALTTGVWVWLKRCFVRHNC